MCSVSIKIDNIIHAWMPFPRRLLGLQTNREL
jgi:hypothetical protein